MLSHHDQQSSDLLSNLSLRSSPELALPIGPTTVTHTVGRRTFTLKP